MVQFDWDDANRGHIARHNVSTTEAEDVILNEPFDLGLQDGEGEDRLVELGQTRGGRILVMISTMRGERVRVVTAFDAPKKWRAYYLARRAELDGSENIDTEV